MSELVRRVQAGVDALKKIGREMELFNKNFAIFAEIVREQKPMTAEETARQNLALKEVARGIRPFPERYVPTEGYAAGAPEIKKEGE